jgi:uncharacterized membrane protein YphA (DoxX/SURF4 family)
MAYFLRTYGIMVARGLLTLLFPLNAVSTIDQSPPAQELLARGALAPIVRLLMWSGRMLQGVAGIALLCGVQQRVAALGLLVFLVPATLTAPPVWLDHTARDSFN